MKSKIKLGLAMFAGGVLMALSGTANATLIGDTVGCNITGSGSTFCLPATAVVDGGVEFIFGFGSGFNDIDIGASTIDLLFNFDTTFGDVVINLTGLDWIGFPGGFITNAELTASNDVNGLSAGDITFGDHSIAIDLDLVSVIRGGTATITLTTDHGKVPEPGTLAIFGFGLLGLGLARRRGKTA